MNRQKIVSIVSSKAAALVFEVLVLLIVTYLLLPPSPGKWALINDVAVPIQVDLRYRVEQIDGKPAQRVSHWIHTMVPLVKCRPGTARIDVVSKDRAAAEERRTFVATLERRKIYRIAERDGELHLVEEPR